MDKKLKEQILAIRDSGLTNMFDVARVQSIAKGLGFYELMVYLINHKEEYSRFILTGKVDK